jgi:hypothetical protein
LVTLISEPVQRRITLLALFEIVKTIHPRYFDNLAQSEAPDREKLAQWRVLALCMAGQTEKAKAVIQAAGKSFKVGDREGWEWLSRTFLPPNPRASK